MSEKQKLDGTREPDHEKTEQENDDRAKTKWRPRKKGLPPTKWWIGDGLGAMTDQEAIQP